MGNFKDLTGQRFGRLTVVRRIGSKRNNVLWMCKCDCGNLKEVISANLVHNQTKSCGCLQKEIASQLNATKTNKYKVVGNEVFVYLENSKEPMICDVEDWEGQKCFTWFLLKNGYVATHKRDSDNYKIVYFHSEITKCKNGLVVDHINRNQLDNRKENLRITTQQINCINKGMYKSNTSGTKGVFKRKDTGKWTANITISHKTIWLGCYETMEEAKNAREKAEEIYHKPLLEMR